MVDSFSGVCMQQNQSIYQKLVMELGFKLYINHIYIYIYIYSYHLIITLMWYYHAIGTWVDSLDFNLSPSQGCRNHGDFLVEVVGIYHGYVHNPYGLAIWPRSLEITWIYYLYLVVSVSSWRATPDSSSISNDGDFPMEMNPPAIKGIPHDELETSKNDHMAN